MSHVHSGPLANYNSLTDHHLSGYFDNPRKRRHLLRAGLITKNGHIVSETTYRLSMAKKEHKKYVKDLLAQTIVRKTLDLERQRQAEIRQKVEEIAKIELVRRVKASCSHKGDESILPLLSPRARHTSPLTSSKTSLSSSDNGLSSASQEHKRKPKHAGHRYQHDVGRPRYMPGTQNSPQKEFIELDSRHLSNLDSVALQKYGNEMSQHESGYRSLSPYLMPQISGLLPCPPKAPRSYPSSARSTRGRSLFAGKKADSKAIRGSLMIHRPEPAMMNQDQVQTMATVTIKYLGKQLVLPRDQIDPYQEVSIDQQHCGGNTLPVFKEKLLPGTTFQFISRRHQGYPFSLSLYIDHVLDCRVSACCEYKHAPGTKLGGKAGHFTFVAVTGTDPCFRCQVEKEMRAKKRKKERRDREAEMKKEASVNDMPVTAVDAHREEVTEVTHDEEVEKIIVPVEDSDAEDLSGESQSAVVDVTNEEKYDEDFEESNDDDSETTGDQSDKIDEGDKSDGASDESDDSGDSTKGDNSDSGSDAYHDDIDTDSDDASSTNKKDNSKTKLLGNDTDDSSRTATPNNTKESLTTSPIDEVKSNRDINQEKKLMKQIEEDSNNFSLIPPSDDKKKVDKPLTHGNVDDAENEERKRVEADDADEIRGYSSDESAVHHVTSQLAVVQVHHGSDENLEADKSSVKSPVTNAENEENSVRGDVIGIPDDDSGKYDGTSDELSLSGLSARSGEGWRAENNVREGQINVEKQLETYKKDQDDKDRNVVSGEKANEMSHKVGVQEEVATARNLQLKKKRDHRTETSATPSSSDSDDGQDRHTSLAEMNKEKNDMGGDNGVKDDAEGEGHLIGVRIQGDKGNDSLSLTPAEKSEELKTISEESSNVLIPTDTSMETGTMSGTNNDVKREDADDLTDDDDDGDDLSSETEDDDEDAMSYQKRYLSKFPDIPGQTYEGSILPLISDSDLVATYNISLNQDQLEEVCKYIEQTPVLSEVTLTNGCLSDDGVQRLCHAINASLASPKILNLSLNQITAAGMSAIVDTVTQKRSLKYLVLFGNPIGDSGVKSLTEGLITSAHATGQGFNLFRGVDTNAYGDSPVNSEIMESIAADRKLSGSVHPPRSFEQTISSKVVEGQRDPSERGGLYKSSLVEEVEALSRELRDSVEKTLVNETSPRNCILEELNLGFCGISNVGAEDIATLIGSNASISSLSLMGNRGISVDGWKRIGAALRQNKSLNRLTLDDCKIHDAGFACIADEIRDNFSLRKLDLANCGLTDVGGKKVVELLKRNTSLVDIRLKPGNDINEDTLNEVRNYLSLNHNFHRPYNYAM